LKKSCCLSSKKLADEDLICFDKVVLLKKGSLHSLSFHASTGKTKLKSIHSKTCLAMPTAYLPMYVHVTPIQQLSYIHAIPTAYIPYQQPSACNTNNLGTCHANGL
jgi:hypothetical protein